MCSSGRDSEVNKAFSLDKLGLLLGIVINVYSGRKLIVYGIVEKLYCL